MRFSKLTGVVACGGESIRMGRDKSLIQYREKPQRYYLYDILSSICSSTVISCRKDQTSGIAAGYDYLIDHPEFANNGPASAVLSTFAKFPGNPLLLLACDYPYLDTEEIKHFLEAIRETGKPAAFFEPSSSKYIPVLAYYPQEAAGMLLDHNKTPGYSLMQYLISQKATKYIPRDLRCLISVDSPEAAASVNLLK
jgi:molybdopterin-guanine dinucleotide biosynthesis protein A